MATINLGNIKFNWQGAYAGGSSYSIDDVVSYNGSSYICKLASTGNLPTNTTYWDQMSSAGTNGTDLTSTLTTQGDLVYRDGSGLQRLGAGTAGQVLQTGGAGANPSWSTVSSDVVKLATVTNTASFASVSVDGYFTSDYKYYELVGLDFYSANDGNCFINFNVSGTSDTSGIYDSTCMGLYGAATGTASQNFHIYVNATGILSRNDISGNSGFPLNNDFKFKIYNPLSTTVYKGFDWSIITMTGGGARGLQEIKGNYKNTSAVSGVTITGNGGVKGIFQLYGYK